MPPLSTTGLSMPPDAPIDLHLHTHFSDGTWTPEGLLDHLVDAGFCLAAIADHDRVDTLPAIQALALDKGMPLLVAVEMSTLWRGEMTDLLCYGFDPEHNTLLELSRDLLRRQQENSREVYANLQRKGVSLPEDPQVLANILAMPSPEQPHGLVALLKSLGYGQGEPSAGRLVQEAGCAYASNDLAAVVEAGHQCGALCLVAHPGRGDGFVDFDAPLLDELRQEVPIDGLEAFYPRHAPARTEMFCEYARRHDLLVSCGSDSHGADKPQVKYRADQSRDLLDRLGIRVG